MELPKFTLQIEKLTSEGVGLARHEGKVFFVPWTVPGEKVVVQIEKEHKDYNETHLLEIVEQSKDRIDPPCPYFYRCGGCQLQHINYEGQLKWKKEIVLDALTRISKITQPIVEEMIPSPKIWNYRSRIQLQKDQAGKIGFYKTKSHEVVEIDSCLIADERLNERSKEVKEGVEGSEAQDKSRETKHEARGTKQEEMESKDAEEDWPLELRVDDSSAFTQINPEQNENLVRLVLEYADVKKTDQIFELFCGSGNFTFPLSQKGGHVWAIDKDSEAVRKGEKISSEKDITNITWKQGTVSRLLSQFKKKGLGCSLLVADPPRSGLAEAMEEILLFSPKKIVYVSCNPATFARDAARLIRSDYRLQKCQPIDMFPQTAHVEVVGLFISAGHTFPSARPVL